MKTDMRPKIETFALRRKDGSHIRLATKVTYPDGRVMRFTERMSKREALRQGEWHR